MSFLFGDSGIWQGTADLTSSATTCAVNTKNARTAIFECTADTSFTCTVEACLDQSGTNWRSVPCIVSDGGSYIRYVAGATVTLTSGDMVFVPSVGFVQVRVTRTAGTASIRSISHPAELNSLTELIGGLAGLSVGAARAAIAVSTTVLKVFGASSWADDAATTNAGKSREIRLTNLDAAGGTVAYVRMVASGTARSGSVSSSDFDYALNPLESTPTIWEDIPAGYELHVVRGSSSSAKVSATELL